MHRDRDLGPSVNSAPEWVICALLALARAGRLTRSAWFAAAVWPVPGPRRRGRVPGECVRRWGAARTEVRRITAATARPAPGPAAAAAGRAASLNSRLASNLQQGIVHTRLSAQRAEPGRAGAYPCPARWRPLTGVPAWAAGNLCVVQHFLGLGADLRLRFAGGVVVPFVRCRWSRVGAQLRIGVRE